VKRISGHRSAEVFAWVFGAAGVMGLLLRLTLRDRLPILAAVFYALPSSVVVVVLALSCALWLRLRRRRRAIASFLAAVVALVVWLETDYVWTAGPDPQEDGLRVVLWNISRPADHEQAFVPVLQEADAQIILLVESGGNADARQRFWQSHFPGYHVYLSDVGVTLLSTYPASSMTMTQLGAKACVGVYDLATSVGMVSVVAVDVESSPFMSRKSSIDNTSWRSKGWSAVTAAPSSTRISTIGSDTSAVSSIRSEDSSPTMTLSIPSLPQAARVKAAPSTHVARSIMTELLADAR